ncbi:SPOR domain-containing protein [Rubrivirga sp.]|uniref:SPOR domain-containing protein n=1 Tax=Rubrivirga sp. TaxID=1885344 RepID=UPI003C796318
MTRAFAHTTFVVVAGISLSACSAFGPGGPASTDEIPLEVEERPGYPAYETFDPTGYDVDPVVATEIVHDVPARVMEGRVVVPDQAGTPAPAEPQARQVDGYRVQVFTSSNRDTAERVRGEAVGWWEGAQSSPGAPSSMEVIVGYQQPYYRVRMGAFATRAEADEALILVRQRYPEAFLVPDLVTVIQ